MSIRIESDGLVGAAAPGSSRPAAINPTGAAGSKAGAGLSGGSGADRVEISSLSESLASASSAADSQRSALVGRLTSLYASGQYRVDSSRVSSAIVSQGLTMGALESTS